MTDFTGTSGNDVLPALVDALLALGDDNFYGLAGDDILIGYTGDDTFYGGSGEDTILGGELIVAGLSATFVASGNNTASYTDSTAGVTIDLSNTFNLVSTSLLGLTVDLFGVSSGIGGDAEGDLMIGVSNLVGSANADMLTGNDDANTLRGMDGNDSLSGGAGTDTLEGGSGADRLDGGTGIDVLDGGLGNDIYWVDNLGDTIINEVAFSSGGGIDTIYSTVDFTMNVNFEVLRLEGTDDLVGIGSSLGEALVGNAGANSLVGNFGNDVLWGRGGDDTLIGGHGSDTVVGQAGADVIVINDVVESQASVGGRDYINGFVNGTDLIDLSGVDADTGTAGDQAWVFVGTDAFSNTAGELRYQSYGGNWNIISGDDDGDGVADLQIFVNQTSTMFETDFVL